MNKELLIGTVGTSSIMNVMQEAIRLTDGVRCSVVCSRSAQRGRKYADQVGVEEVCTDYTQLIRRSDLDIIYLATPNSCHFEQARAALTAGRHVIVEKPASLTRDEIDQLHETALEHGVYFFEAITTIFMPHYLACRNILPWLGELKEIEICYGQYSSKMDAYRQGIIASSLDPALKGGALNDMGIYCIHVAADLFGEPDEVVYEPIYGPNEADLEGTLTLRYPGLVPVVIRTSKQRDIGSACRLIGENGSFTEDGPINDFKTCEATIQGRQLQLQLQGTENRMLYELARFRDAINSRDDAFYYRMVRQSRIAAGVLEEAHRQMSW